MKKTTCLVLRLVFFSLLEYNYPVLPKKYGIQINPYEVIHIHSKILK